jgi:hypothetical protein
MPVLRELIGLDWPVGHDLEVRERYTPALEGYAGVFYSDESIDVSEDLDPLVIVHEASHAWFDERLFSGRWIYEGLAQEYAWRVVARIDDGAPPPDRPAPDDPGAVALTQWSHPGVIRDQETDAAERYGYAASWWVVHEIVAVVGEERMRLAFERAMNDTTAYLGAGPPEHHPGADGFARLYDLVEDVTAPPSPRIDAAFRTYVMTPAQAPLLDDRSEARTAYRGLLAAGDGWLPPWYVRRPMDEWQFTVAQDRIAEATIVLELRDQVVAEAAGLGLEPDAGLRSAYETTGTGFGAATELARAEIAALDEIDEARQRLEAERDLLTTIGLLDADPEGPYEAARAAFEAGNLDLAVGLAASSVAAIAGAAAIGQQRLLGGVAVTAAVLLLLVVLLVWRRRARRGRTAARAAVAALTGDPAPVGREAYATLAADRADRSEPPAAAALDGGAGQGETPGEQ